MPYKKYIKRNGKSYGPYVYHSRKEGGKVITEYHGKFENEKKYLSIGIFLFLFIFSLIALSFLNLDTSQDFSLSSITSFATLKDSENQQIEFSDPLVIIRFVIEIISAEHLDENRKFISDIYEETKELDDVWSEEISDGEYVRVTFEENLTSENDITIFPRVISGDPKIEVYEKDGTEIIVEFFNIISEAYNKVLLTNLKGIQDTFDLKILDGSLMFDYIFDPDEILYVDALDTTYIDWTTSGTTPFLGDNTDEVNTASNNAQHGIWDFANSTGSGDFDVILYLETQQDATNEDVEVHIANSTGVFTLEGTISPPATYGFDTINLTLKLSTFAEIDAARMFIIYRKGGPASLVHVRRAYLNVTTPAAADNPPQWFDNSTNSTEAGEPVLHSVRWTDETDLSGYIFEFDNGTGSFTNDSFVTFTGTTNFSNVTKVVNSTQGSTIRWRVYANDSTNQLNATPIFTYITTTDSPPTWSQVSANETTPDIGDLVRHDVNWSDDTALSFATLEVNGTGANCDTTANVSSTSLSGLTQFANLTWPIPSACEGKVIGWKQYANDSANQWNVTDVQQYTVNNVNPTASFGTNPIDNFNSSSGSVTFDLKVSDNLGVDYLRLYGDWGGSWTFNQTNTTPVNDTIWSVTVNGILEGQHLWAAWGNDTLGNEDFTDTNRTFTVDLTTPNVTINDPQNQSYTTNSILFNVTSVDNFGISTCTYSLNGEANVSLTNSAGNFWDDTNSSMDQGSHTVTYYCTDFAGNVNGTEQVTFFIDSLNPLIEFVAPTEANGTSKSGTWIFANVTVTETNFQNVTFKLFNSTGLLNETTRTTQDFEINWTGLNNSDVLYWYNVSTYDQYGNFNETETRYITLTSDNPPIITILYPQNITYNVNVSELNYTVTDDNPPPSACWYSLDGGVTNSSFDFTCSNFTGLTSIEGQNNWTVYANDSIDQLDSDVVFFFKDTIFPQFSSHIRNPSTPNEDQDVQVNVTITESNKDTVILEWNGTTNYTITTSNGDEFFYTVSSGNYTAHDPVTYYWYANDTAGNLNRSAQQSFTVANQIPTVSASSLNDTTPLTNDLISCDGGTFSDNDAEDFEQDRFFLWYDSGVEISGQTSQTLDLSTSGLDKGDTIICSVRVYDGFDNSTFVNSSNTATIQNSAPVITNPLTSVSWDANGSTFTYDYDFTDADGDSVIWYDNTTLFDINGTGFISDTPTESEAGIYEIRISVDDGTVNTTDDFTYTINDVTSPNIDFVSPTEANDSQLIRDFIQVNVTASDVIGIDTIIIRLYNSTSLVQTNTSTSSPLFVNFTNLPDEVYYFNSTVNDTSGNENNTETRTVSTDTGPPTINYVAPTENSGVFKDQNYIEINVTAGDPNLDTILIRLYNSTNDLINSSTTTSSPNFINFSGLADGLYYYNATANDTFGNSADLTTRNITLDVTNPLITNLVEDPSDPATYSTGVDYQFNATITDDNLDTVLIEFDNVNYTPTQTGSVYNLTLSDLIAGVHNYTWFSNDSVGNVNVSIQTYTINKAAGNVNLLINDTADNQTGIYGVQTNASALTTQGTITLFRNGTDITSENNIFVTLAANFYNYTAVSGGNENYTSVSTTLFVDISKASSEVNLTLNNTDGNVTIVQDSFIYLNTTTIGGDSGATLRMYRAGILINEGTSPISNFTQFSSVGVFNITGFYIESENFTGSFETWYVNVTETPDVTNPSVTGLTESPSDPATYDPSNIYEFNATVTDNRDLDVVLIDFDGVNYTVTNFSGDVYNFTITGLSVGTYNYRWYANDTSGNENNTENGSYTINQATPSLNLVITPSESETYGTETTATGSNCPSELTCILYRDGVAVTNPETSTLAASTYNYTYNTTGNANYTSYSNTTNLTIIKETGVVFTYLNNSRANITIEQFTEIYLNGTLETGIGTITLYRNGTVINQGNSPLSNLTNFIDIGLNNITTIYSGNENFTSAFETFFVDVIELDVTPPSVQVLYPTNISYTLVQTELNYTASDNFGLDQCWYSLEGGSSNITIACGTNVTGLNSGEGSSTWTVYANDSKGNENSSSVTFFVDSINPIANYVSPTETSGDTFGRNYIQVNVTASDTNLDTITIYLYNSTSLVQTNTSSSSPFFVNFTGLNAETYFFNATVNDTVGNEVSLNTRNVSLVVPNLTIIRPENETYFDTTELLLSFTASFENFVWYNIDGGANTTISGNTTFNASGGQRILNLYANNTVGETLESIVFTVDLSKFKIIYDDYAGNTSGSSTDFNQSSFEDIQNLSGIILENIDHGKIEFSEALNLTNDSTPGDNQLDIDSNVNISFNLIELNSSALPNFNKSATLYLYDLTFSNPQILRDGVLCPTSICTKISYSGGTLKFNVTQFTKYSAEETPADVSPPGVGAGVGGGSTGIECINNTQCTEENEVCWNHQCVQLFDIKIIEFESPVKLGEFFDFTYFLKGMADINDDVQINFWIEKNGEIISSGSDTIYIGSFEEKTETTKIFLPSTVESGVYTFYVEIVHAAYTAKSHRTIEIQVEKGVAFISPIKPERFKGYLMAFFIFVAFLVLSLILYVGVRVLQGLIEKVKLISKGYKLTFLISLLVLILGFIFYYFNVFGKLSNLMFELPSLILILDVILAIAIFIGIIFIFVKRGFFTTFNKFLERIKIDRLLKKKYKEKAKESKKIFKRKEKRFDLLKWGHDLFNKIGSFFTRIYRSFKPLEDGTIIETKKTIEKVEKGLFEFSSFIDDKGKSFVKKIGEAEKQLRGFKVPKLRLPKFKLPKFKLPKLKFKKDLFKREKILLKKSYAILKRKIKGTEREFKGLRVPKLKFKFPRFRLPKLKIRFPKFRLPKISLPKFKLPKFRLPKYKFKKDLFRKEKQWLKKSDIALKRKFKEDKKKFKRIKIPKFKLPKISLPKFKLPKFKFLRFSLPKFKSFKLPEYKLKKDLFKREKQWLKRSDIILKRKIREDKKIFRKLKTPKFKLPKISLPKFKLPKFEFPRFRLPKLKIKLTKFKFKLPESKLLGRFKDINFVREKKVFIKSERYVDETFKKSIKTTREIYHNILGLLTKVFGTKSQRQLIKDFEKHFVKRGEFTKRNVRVLREIANATKNFDKNKSKLYERSDVIKKNAAIFLNDLFGYLKNNKLIAPGKERNRIEKKIKIYSKELNSAILLSRKIFRNTKNALRKADKFIYSAYSEIKRDILDLRKNFEEIQKRQKENKLIKGFFNRKEDKRKTARRIVDEVSREIRDSTKDHEMKDIIEDIAEREKQGFSSFQEEEEEKKN